jgi:hypothetical protein
VICIRRGNREIAVVNAVTSAKSGALNTLEGIALTAFLVFFPTMTGAALLSKLTHMHQGVDAAGGAASFVLLSSLTGGLFAWWWGPRYALFKPTYEPVFFDTSLSFTGKFVAWCERPKRSHRLLTMVFMLSLLAIGVLSTG